MKHFIVIITMVGLMCSTANAQWHQVNSNTTESLHDILMIDSLNGYCVGTNGTILKSTDGGENWNLISIAANTETFTDVFFIDLDNGFVKSNENIYKTIDGGQTFQSLSSLISSSVYPITSIALEFNKNIGFINVRYFNSSLVPQTVIKTWKTNNFGQSWVSIPNIPHSQKHIVKIIDSLVWFSAEFYYYKTTDGGMNWTQSTSFFFDFPPETNNAWYVKDTSGAGMIGMTYHYDFKHIVDFNTLSSDFSTHGWEMKIDVVDSLGYLLFKGAGTPQLTQLKRTTDYGQTFSAQIDTLNNGINNLDFVSQSLGFLCGNNGEIYKTTNGGSTVGVNESDVKKKINIYPNPSANNLSIENLGQQQTVTIEIRNVTGQVVYTQKEANFSKITVNTNNIPVGVYFVNIKAGQQNLATQKWVKVE